jgi:hypothetical protein
MEQYLQEGNGLALKKKSDSGIVESQAIPGFAIEIAALFDEQNASRLASNSWSWSCR